MEGAELEVQMAATHTRVLGLEHSDTLISMVNLAHIWKGKNDDKLATVLRTCCPSFALLKS